MVKTTSPSSPPKKTQGPSCLGTESHVIPRVLHPAPLMVYQKVLELVDKPWDCCLHSELAQTCSLGQDLPISLGVSWDIAGGRSHLPA